MSAGTQARREATAASRRVVVMGVSGSGKTSVAEALARRLGLGFLEGDRLHPAENIDKMSKGTPLTDADRLPWLDRIGEHLHAATVAGQGIIVSCSALKRAYRDRLRSAAAGPLTFVFLDGSHDLLLGRMQARSGHFMPAGLLDSQFAALEDPTGEPDVVSVCIDAPLGSIVDDSLARLAELWKTQPAS